MNTQQVRRRSDGSLDIEFYRRRAIALRAEMIAQGLRAAWRVARQWTAAIRHAALLPINAWRLWQATAYRFSPAGEGVSRNCRKFPDPDSPVT